MTDSLLDATTVQVEVKKLLPFGILVSLSDESEGIIREREIAWDHQSRHSWRHRFKIGDSLKVVPLGVGHGHRHEFSLRLADNDPWADIIDRFPLGTKV